MVMVGHAHSKITRGRVETLDVNSYLGSTEVG